MLTSFRLLIFSLLYNGSSATPCGRPDSLLRSGHFPEESVVLPEKGFMMKFTGNFWRFAGCLAAATPLACCSITERFHDSRIASTGP